MNNWEIVCKLANYEYTERLAVPGGWLYRTVIFPDSETQSVGIAMAFVPNAPGLQSEPAG